MYDLGFEEHIMLRDDIFRQHCNLHFQGTLKKSTPVFTDMSKKTTNINKRRHHTLNFNYKTSQTSISIIIVRKLTNHICPSLVGILTPRISGLELRG
jgi:hypothetical protein